MCGVTALLLNTSTRTLGIELAQSLHAIQHRGYDGAGLALDSNDGIILAKGYGLISEVLNPDLLNQVAEVGQVRMGLAHTRYKTVGEVSSGASQPIISPNKHICLVHNGQIEAKEYLPDSVKIMKIFDQYYSGPESITSAIKQIMKQVKGAYSCVIMIHNVGLLAFRDMRGIRPLVYSQSAHGDVAIASEDVAIRANDRFKLSLVNDVPPGKAILFGLDGSTPKLLEIVPISEISLTPCIFEYIYLAHNDSSFNGIDVKTARRQLGKLLAEQIKINYPQWFTGGQNSTNTSNKPLIVPVPETSCIACQEMAHQLDFNYVEALILNPKRSKARTFILPTQELREKAVKQKFNIDPDPVVRKTLENSHVLLVDDSIVRGTTLTCVIRMLRETAKVKQITVASLAPPVKYKNIYGIDIPDDKRLIANGLNLQQISDKLGADQIIYQNLTHMVENFLELGCDQIVDFECSLFTGKY